MPQSHDSPPQTPSRPSTPAQPQVQVSQNQVLTESSPRIHRSTGGHSNLVIDRPEIGEEMDHEMLVCDVDRFQRSYLPFVPADNDVTACIGVLKKSGLLVQDDGKPLQWTAFQKTPSGIPKSEKDVFVGIAEIAGRLARCVLQSSAADNRYSMPLIEYLNCPNNHIASEIPGANFKIDGCFALKRKSDLFSSSKILAPPNIVVVAEYKKYLSKQLDNRLKVVSAASHIMNDDPRRAFMFGITIEDAMVSLWYFSRSHSAKSKPFDFMKEPNLLISIFLSFLFGHETGLGYDPAIRRCPGAPVYYEYKVGDRHYRTLGPLSNYRSLGITGRMTRVWKAVEIPGFKGAPVPGKKEVALKDVWLDQNARTEQEIQNSIFRAINEQKELHKAGGASRLDAFNLPRWSVLLTRIKADLENENFRRYFMTIDCDHLGQITKPIPTGAVPTTGIFTAQEEAQTRSFQLEGSDPRRGQDILVRPSSSTAARSAKISARATPIPAPAPSAASAANVATDNTVSPTRKYQPKRRYFLVFSDVGQALHDVSTLPAVFHALRDIILALVFLFIGNWVHRDISTGNIIVMVNGKTAHGKLSDLEYAKEFGSATISPDPKTGTPFFMAFELLAGCPLNKLQMSSGEVGSVTEDLLAQFLSPEDQPPVSNLPNVPIHPNTIIYTFQHDLESVFWIILWTLLARVAHPPGQNYVPKIYINKLENTSERCYTVVAQNHLRDALQTKLHGGLSGFALTVSNFGRVFWSAYIDRENKDLVREPSSYAAIYVEVMGFLANCLNLSTQGGVPQLISLHPREVVEPTKSATTDGTGASKRPHSDDEDSDIRRPCPAERRLQHERLSI